VPQNTTSSQLSQWAMRAIHTSVSSRKAAPHRRTSQLAASNSHTAQPSSSNTLAVR